MEGQTDKHIRFYGREIKIKGTPGFEPGTSRSAVECSTTELYPHDELHIVYI